MEPTPPSELSARVAAFVAALDKGSSLDILMGAMSHALRPSISPGHVTADLDSLAARCSAGDRDDLVRWLIDDEGFGGDRTDYHGWRNSCLAAVIERRRGMPITLSVVVVEIARRLGFGLVGVGMPGHFLVGDGGDGDWFADPFEARTGLSAVECEARYHSMGGGRWSPEMLAPSSDRTIVARVLNNLRVSCERRGDAVRLAVTMELRRHLPELREPAAAVRRAGGVLN